MIALENVLVATDFGEPGEAALRYGVELARRFDAVLHVLHVVEDLAARPSALPGALVDVGPLQDERIMSAVSFADVRCRMRSRTAHTRASQPCCRSLIALPFTHGCRSRHPILLHMPSWNMRARPAST